jgi:hypothetical protein
VRKTFDSRVRYEFFSVSLDLNQHREIRSEARKNRTASISGRGLGRGRKLIFSHSIKHGNIFSGIHSALFQATHNSARMENIFHMCKCFRDKKAINCFSIALSFCCCIPKMHFFAVDWASGGQIAPVMRGS